MSKKFTGITSAGSAIPVYDKDAHSALEQKLDISAFSSVSGEFATVDDVVAAVSGKADTSAIPSLDGYATEEWVGEQGYLTEVPDEYAKTSAVEDMVSAASADLYSAIGDKLDTSSFADVSGSFLTEVPESAVSGFATHEEVVSSTSGKMNVSGLASGQTTGQQWFNPTVYSAYNGIPFFAAYTSGNKLDTSAAEAVSPNFSRNSDQNNGYAKFSGWNENVGIDISGAHKNKRIYITDEGIILSGYSSHEDAGMNVNGHYLNITPENYVDKTTFKNIVTGNNETFVPNDVKTASGNYDMQYYNYSFIGDFSGNDNLGREFTVTLPVATTSFRYTACEQNWNWLYEGTLTAEEPKTEWKITPNKDYTAKQDYSISTGTFYTFQITQSPFPTTGGVVSASIETWNDEVFATRPWVEEQLSANVPQGVMQTSGLEYDGDKISGYMGSAFKAGDELPEYVTAAADLVSASSGAWNEVSAKQPIGNYASASDIPELMAMSAGEGISISEVNNTILIETSGLQPSGNYLTAVPDTYLQNTDLSTADGMITAISGIPLSAGGGGGDVPEGVMSESGLGFNAVNEISGYNGSAIAQYGAAKQWLTHDDTLVHLSNSAQYALGVNLSGISADLAQMISGDLAINYDIDNVTFAGWYDGKYPIWQRSYTATFQVSTAWNAGGSPILSAANKPWSGAARYWIDPSNSYVYYGSTSHHLPTTWMLGANRFGCVEMLNDGNVYVRCIDASTTNCTARINIKWVSAVN